MSKVQRMVSVFVGGVVCVLLFDLVLDNTLLWLVTSLLVVVGGWVGSRAILESNRVIHLERFIHIDQIPPSVGDDEDLDQEIVLTVKKIIRDFVSSWFSSLSSDPGFESQVEYAMKCTAMNLKHRVQLVDSKVVSCRILHLLGRHLQDYSSSQEAESKQKTKKAGLWRTYFTMTSPHMALSSDQVEVDYVRAVVSLLLHVLVPPPHLETRTGRFVVGELITCNLLLPLVDKLSDPDWLNLLIIDIFGPAHKPHGSPAPPAEPEPATVQQEVHTSAKDLESTETGPSEGGSDQVDSSHTTTEEEQDHLDSPLPLTDPQQISTHSLVLIGQEDRDGGRKHEVDLEEEEPSPASLPRVLVTSEEPENNTEPGVMGGEQSDLTLNSPMVGCSSMGTFSFEPLISPEGPVIIQNLRITGTITAKEYRGTGSHPYTLYTIKYETALGSETTGGIQTSSEDAEATPTYTSPDQSVAYHKVNRRYSEFLNLQTRLEEKSDLRKLSKGVKGPKKILPDMPFGNMDSEKIESRKGLLETFLKNLCAIPEIANSEEMQEFLALNTDARIAFVKKPFVVSRIDKMVVNAIVDTLKTAFPRTEAQSPPEDEMDVWDKKTRCRVKAPPTKALPVLNGSDIIRPPVMIGLDHSVYKGMSLAELESAISELEKVTMETGSDEHGGTLTYTHSHGVSVCETELSDVALNVVCVMMKDQWSYLCTETIQRTIRLLFGTLINRWLAVGVANLTSPRYWVTYLQVVQEEVWPGGVLPTEEVQERSQQQKELSRRDALKCLMDLLPGVLSDVLGSEKYKMSFQTLLDSFQDPVINRHLVYCLFDLLMDFLLPELPEEDFQNKFLNILSRDPEKMIG